MKKDETLVEKWRKINLDLKDGYKFRAADNLRSILNSYPDKLFISNKLAELYFEAGLYDGAGKYWLMYPSNEYRVIKCIELYKESMGNSATRILNDLEFKGDRSKLRNFSREILEELEEKSKKEGGYVCHLPIYRDNDLRVKSEMNWFREAFWMFVKIIFLLFLAVGVIASLSWIQSLIR